MSTAATRNAVSSCENENELDRAIEVRNCNEPTTLRFRYVDNAI